MAKLPNSFKQLSPLTQRLVSGILLALITFGFLAMKGVGVFGLACLVIMPLSFEWGRLCHITQWRRGAYFLTFWSWGVFLSMFMGLTFFSFGFLFLGVSLLLLVGWLTWRHGFVWLAVGVVYLTGALACTIWLAENSQDPFQLFVWALVVVSANDSGGYFFGKAIGGVKLAPVISPNKTWAGFAGGIALALTLATGLWFLWGLQGDFAAYALLVAVTATVASIGDLLASAVKRFHKVKDSGSLIPGHGGVLDRLDAYFLVLPVLAGLLHFTPGVFSWDQGEAPSSALEESVLLDRTNSVE